MTPLDASLRRHLHAIADESVSEGQIDRATAAVQTRRQAPGWLAGLRSPEPSDPTRFPSGSALLTRAYRRGRTVALIAAIVIVAIAGVSLGVIGALPKERATVLPSPAATTAPSPVLGGVVCTTEPIGAWSAGCIDVPEGSTFSLALAAHVDDHVDMLLAAVDGELYLRRPDVDYWRDRNPLDGLTVLSAGGKGACLQAIRELGSLTSPAGAELAGFPVMSLANGAVLCAETYDSIGVGGHVLEISLEQLRPAGVAGSVRRVASFAWIDWGPRH